MASLHTDGNMPEADKSPQSPPDEDDGAVVLLPDPSLLALPREIRNIILSYTLLEPDRNNHNITVVNIDQLSHVQPGIIHTWTQLRAEAMELLLRTDGYYISVTMRDMKLAPQINHWIWQSPLYDSCVPWVGETWSEDWWPNILEWLEIFHDDASKAADRRPTDPEDGNRATPMYDFFKSLFQMVEKMRDLAWYVVAEVVEE